MKNYLFTFFILLAGSCLFAQNIQLLGSTNTSAFGSGVSGVPNNLVWDIPAGQNRVMIVHLQFERDHSPIPPNSDNWPSGNFGADYFPLTVGGVAMTGRSVLRGYYKLVSTSGTVNYNNSDFSTVFYRYTLSDADGLPTGTTTFDFSGINLPVNVSDEAAVSIEVYGNVSPSTSYVPTGAAFRDNTNSNTTTINLTPTATTPVGRAAADVMYVAFGATSKDETLGISSGWTTINNMRVNNNVSVLPIPATGTNPANEGDGISLLTAYRNGSASTTLTKSSNERIVNFRLNIVPLLPLAKPTISGTVYNDSDGHENIGGSGTNGGGLYINVVDENNLVVYAATVASGGTFTIPAGIVTEGNTYSLQLSKNQGITGQSAPAKELNAGWSTVGESTASTGNDGIADGILSITAGTVNITNLRYGITNNAVNNPISCDTGKVYVLMHSGGTIAGLYTIDINDGSVALVKDPLISSATNRMMNALGYNERDGYLYAYRKETNQIVKIDAQGNVQFITVSGLTIGDYSSGDIKDNALYLYRNGIYSIVRIDLSSLAVTTIPFTVPDTPEINDFAFGPGGHLYGMTTAKKLFKIDISTGALTYLGDATGLSSQTGSFGTVYMDSGYNLYVGNNGSRKVFRFKYNAVTEAYSMNAEEVTEADGVPGREFADGASCPFVLLPSAEDDEICAPSLSQPAVISVLDNDIKKTFEIDPSSVRLIDPATSLPVTSVTIAGQGTFTVDTVTGRVTFSRLGSFTGVSVGYVVADVSGNVSEEAQITITNCITYCIKPGTNGTPLESSVGILTKGNEPSVAGWPESVPNGYLVMDAYQKGMVITHTTEDQIQDPVEGMLIYDTEDKCVKLYRGLTPGVETTRTEWVCIERVCNE